MTMKKRMIVVGAVLAVVVIGFTSCEKSEDLNVNDIEGVYEGAFSVSSSLKAASLDASESHHETMNLNLTVTHQANFSCSMMTFTGIK